MKTSDLTPRERELFEAYLAGFDISGEGFNAEYPFGDKDIDPTPMILPRFRKWLRAVAMKRSKKRIAR